MITTLYPMFRKWSEGGNAWIYSDPHFGSPDRKSLGYDLTEEEQTALINRYCHEQDTFICLGCVGNPAWVSHINGHKVLIMDDDVKDKSKYERKITRNGRVYVTPEDAMRAVECGEITSFRRSDCGWHYDGFTDNGLFDEVYDGPLFISGTVVLSGKPVCVTSAVTGEPVAFNIHGDGSRGSAVDDRHLNCTANMTGFIPLNLKDILDRAGKNR